MALKSLYSFTLEQEKEIEKTSTRKNKKTGEIDNSLDAQTYFELILDENLEE